MLDENEFLSPYGIRALSRHHLDHPYILPVNGMNYRVDYEPAESSTGLFGGNSNWRGPIWFPVNYLLIESLQKFHHFLGDDYKVECPTGSGHEMDLWQVAGEISRRLTRIFLRDEHGRRPVFGGTEKFQRTRSGATSFCFMNTFTATTAPASAPATRPAGPLWSRNSCSNTESRLVTSSQMSVVDSHRSSKLDLRTVTGG